MIVSSKKESSDKYCKKSTLKHKQRKKLACLHFAKCPLSHTHKFFFSHSAWGQVGGGKRLTPHWATPCSAYCSQGLLLTADHLCSRQHVLWVSEQRLACGWQPRVWDTGDGKQWLWCFEFDCSNSFGHILTYRTFHTQKPSVNPKRMSLSRMSLSRMPFSSHPYSSMCVIRNRYN